MKPAGTRLHILILTLGCGLAAGAIALRSHFQTTMVVGHSMEPTLHNSDLLLVDKQAYVRADPARGDIVVARYRNDLLVKRIVGLPGEEVEVVLGILHINGAPIAEKYFIEPGPLSLSRGMLSKERFALLGDNRALREGETVHAIVPKDQIVGKVIARVHFKWKQMSASIRRLFDSEQRAPNRGEKET